MSKRKILFIAMGTIFLFLRFFSQYTTPFIAIPSKSMEPAFKAGDLVIVKRVSQPLKKGDVVVVNIPKDTQKMYGYPSSVVHRIHKVEAHPEYQHMYRIKGDNNVYEDPFAVFPDHVKGMVATRYSHIGHVILFIHSTQGFIFLMLVTLMWFAYEIHGFYRRKKEAIKRGVSAYMTYAIQEELKDIQKDVKKMREYYEKKEKKERKKTNKC